MYKKKKHNKEEELLKLNMITLIHDLQEHRDKCQEYSYSGKLKRALTMAIKRGNEFIDIFKTVTITEKLKERYMQELRYHLNITMARKDYTLVAADFAKVLPEEFIDDTSKITGFVHFQEKQLHRAIKKHEDKYKSFYVWYEKFNTFLEKEIYV